MHLRQKEIIVKKDASGKKEKEKKKKDASKIYEE